MENNEPTRKKKEFKLKVSKTERQHTTHKVYLCSQWIHAIFYFIYNLFVMTELKKNQFHLGLPTPKWDIPEELGAMPGEGAQWECDTITVHPPKLLFFLQGNASF